MQLIYIEGYVMVNKEFNIIIIYGFMTKMTINAILAMA